jgi:hypothetical protein
LEDWEITENLNVGAAVEWKRSRQLLRRLSNHRIHQLRRIPLQAEYDMKVSVQRSE